VKCVLYTIIYWYKHNCSPLLHSVGKILVVEDKKCNVVYKVVKNVGWLTKQ